MAEPLIPESLRGLVLSASELRAMRPNWPDRLIEGYLAIFDNFKILSDVVNQKNDKIKITTLVTFAESPYEIRDTDEEVFFDTTTGDIVANLRPGVDGRNYRLINTSLTSGNKVIVNPFGTELLFGENNPEFIYDAEVLIVTYEENTGWY